MNDMTPPVAAMSAPIRHPFEFRGSGGEFFRIWIVNIALSLVTIGIYSAWAKVRTRRYFYGNTYVAGHAFDYHASPVRILIGRILAVGLFIAYSVTAGISPLFIAPWILVFIVAAPWLIVSSRRFNARNTSYRNVRFNFTGRYWGAFKAFILWPIAGLLTLGILMPLARKRRDYFYVNHHTYGSKPFATSFSTWSIYSIYLLALALVVASFIVLSILVGVIGAVAGADLFAGAQDDASVFSAEPDVGAIGRIVMVVIALIGVLSVLMMITVAAYIGAKVLNLVLDNTELEGRHRLNATLSPWALVWIGVTNLILVLATIGLYYPWARVRVAHYLASQMSLLASSKLDEYSSEAFATQSAVGEEVAGFFDVDIGI